MSKGIQKSVVKKNMPHDDNVRAYQNSIMIRKKQINRSHKPITYIE